VSGQLHAPAALPPGKSPRHPFYRRLRGPQSRSRRYGEVKIFYRTGTRTPAPLVVQPVASRYTDWAIPAHQCYGVPSAMFETGNECWIGTERSSQCTHVALLYIYSFSCWCNLTWQGITATLICICLKLSLLFCRGGGTKSVRAFLITHTWSQLIKFPSWKQSTLQHSET
jgi:hypothetical protein